MFKTSFSKYITAFVIIILVSFITLSGIITSIIKSRLTQDKEDKVALSAEIISTQIEDDKTEDIGIYVSSEQCSVAIKPLVNFDTQVDVLVCDPDGKIILSTIAKGAILENGMKDPVIDLGTGFGKVPFDLFTEVKSSGDKVFVHKGTMNGVLSESSVVYANDIVTNGKLRGYVIALSSTVREDALMEIARNAVFNSSIWVMLAAVIAAYFITERIVRPMRAMTNAAKSFAKGDFSARVVVTGKDEVSELGKAFNNMAESLDSLEKMRNSFLANVSHDLRTPMTTISGFIDGITSGAIPPEKHEYYLNIIQAEVHRLSRLVSEILDVSRLESGERKFNFVDFDIAEMARIILISFEQKIDAKRLDVEFETDDDAMFVTGDKDAIYQVLYNLCHNAIKFARDGGKFAINIGRIEHRKIKISVFDEGQAIAAEDIKLVFDRFYKTDKSRGLDKTGVGLGLYISKTIIEAHGERIWAESNGIDNSEFVFTLSEGDGLSRRKTASEATDEDGV
ncbi:MAG: HAMP domain-containing histidine kinase [Clostridia bacterium]|nr:HAMP domain-containing histidine kinase [Clostridia bacterium]